MSVTVLINSPAATTALFSFLFDRCSVFKVTFTQGKKTIVASSGDEEANADDYVDHDVYKPKIVSAKGFSLDVEVRSENATLGDFSSKEFIERNTDDIAKIFPKDEADDFRAVLTSLETDATHVLFDLEGISRLTKDKPNADVRGMVMPELEEMPYANSIDLPTEAITLEEAVKLAWTVKSHKFDNWYERCTGVNINKKTGCLEVLYDHGS